MKLIDILKQELPKRGGWPAGAVCVVQSIIDGELYFYDRPYDGKGAMAKYARKYKYKINTEAKYTPGGLRPVVTREQYEAAIAVWNGEGLPPVGTECERSMNGNDWFKTTIVAHSVPSYREPQAAFCDNDGKFNGWGYESAFRPIRSERDKAVDEMLQIFSSNAATGTTDALRAIYDAIAAGEIASITLVE